MNEPTETARDTASATWDWHLGWVVTLVANLPLCLWLGWWIGDGEFGRGTIVVAVVFVWLLGHLGAHLFPDFAATVLTGSVCTALLQVLFVPHFIAGLIALCAAIHITSIPVVVIFLATLFTAAQLIVAAWLFGLVFRATIVALARVDRCVLQLDREAQEEFAQQTGPATVPEYASN